MEWYIYFWNSPYFVVISFCQFKQIIFGGFPVKSDYCFTALFFGRVSTYQIRKIVAIFMCGLCELLQIIEIYPSFCF